MADRARLLGSNNQYSHYPLGVFTSAMKELRLSRLDFVPRPPHFWCGHTGYEDPSQLKTVFCGAGLQVEVLTPPPYRYSITASPGIQRQATLSYYKNCLSLARQLGASRMVLGAAGACWDTRGSVLWRNAKDMLSSLCEEAERENVTLLLGAVMGSETPLIAESPLLTEVDEILRMLEEIRHPRLRAMLDTNVMSSLGETIPQWLDALGTHLYLVRLVDGNYHGWCAWGDGCLPMARYLKQLEKAGYAGDISLLLPGERYVENPRYPEEAVFRILNREEEEGHAGY